MTTPTAENGERMHPLALDKVIRSVSKRVAQGDCPTEPAQPVEILEQALLELSHRAQARRIRGDPDDEPTAGNEPQEQP